MPPWRPNRSSQKSRSNAGTEREGLGLLLTDPGSRFRTFATKRRILELIGQDGDPSESRTFDAVMTPEPVGPIVSGQRRGLFLDLRLDRNEDHEEGDPERIASWILLRGYASASTTWHGHWEIATSSRSSCSNSANEYGRPFAVLLTLEEVERRTQKRRIQYQVNFRSDLTLGWREPARVGWSCSVDENAHPALVARDPGPRQGSADCTFEAPSPGDNGDLVGDA